MACTNEKVQQIKEKLVDYKHNFGDFWYHCSVGEHVLGFIAKYPEHKNNADVHYIIDCLKDKCAELNCLEKAKYGYCV